MMFRQSPLADLVKLRPSKIPRFRPHLNNYIYLMTTHVGIFAVYDALE